MSCSDVLVKDPCNGCTQIAKCVIVEVGSDMKTLQAVIDELLSRVLELENK